MTESQTVKYNAYLLRVLQKRSAELKAAYQYIVQLDHGRVRSIKADAFAQTNLESDDCMAIQTLSSFSSTDCDGCCMLKETVEETRRQLDDLAQCVSDRDNELAALKQQLHNSAETVAELRAQADTEAAARKVKEEEVEELEGLIMLCKSESLAAEQHQTAVENNSREYELLKLELNAVKASLQSKDEVLAQNILEKDDLEEVNARLEADKSLLLHQLEELQLQLQDQKSQFDGEIQHLADKKQQLMDEMRTLQLELTKCKQAAASVPFSCSQTSDFLASQQPSELSSIKLELLTVQAEKDDLIQQLHECKTELFQICQSKLIQQDSKNNDAQAPMSTKPAGTTSSDGELASHNAALLGQLLVVEDQLSECETQLQKTRDGHQQSTEQLKTALKKLSDSSSLVDSLEREKLQLATELNAAKTDLETLSARLQECETSLSLVEGKLSSMGTRQRQLVSQKQTLETQNRELLRRLQLATSASKRQEQAVSLESTNVASVEHIMSNVEVKENQVTPSSRLAATGNTFRQQIKRDIAPADGRYRGKLPTDRENRVSSCSTVSTSFGRPLVSFTASPATSLAASKTPASSVCAKLTAIMSENSASGFLKRRITERNAGVGGKRHLFGFNSEQIG